MPHSKRSVLWQMLLRLKRSRKSHNAKRLSTRRSFRVEQLEERALLATIVWGNAAGGNWNVNTNWVGNQVPADNDDVVIPDLAGAPTITFNTGTRSLKSLSISENFVLAGGTFSATTISQLGGSFNISGGTLNSGALAVGTANVTVGATFGNLTIANGATLNVANNATVLVATNSALTIAGAANFGVGSSLVLNQTNSTSSQLIVSNQGVVTATGATFNKSGNWSENTYINVNGGGRLIASGSTFSVSQMLLGNNVVFNAGDWAGNKFDTTLFVPHTVIPFLSAAGGGSDNARFQDIYINTGALASGTLDLRAIGTETTVNLKYIFNGNFTVPTTTTLNVLAGVKAWVATNSALTVSGSANFGSGSSLTLWQTNSTSSQLIVNNQGVVTATDTTFNKSGNWSENTFFRVNDGGRLIASGSKFDLTIYIPYTVIPFLSAAGGGSDNARFQDIYINTGALASGTLDLRAIGTETTANLNYVFNGNFAVPTGATLNVLTGVKAWVPTNSALTVTGSANFGVGSSLTLWQTNSTSSQLIVSNQGVVTATGTTFNKSGNWSENTYIRVNDGGRLIASGSTFSVSQMLLGNNVVFNAGDWSGNKFDTTLYIPHTVIPFLSAAGGGSDNARFQDIYISTGTLASGTLDLRAIGTETTANLNYVFNGNFTVPTSTTLNVLAGVKAWVATNSALTVSGSASFGVGSSLTLWQTSSASSQLIVSNQGVVTATGTTFNKSGNWSENTYIRVNDGGRLIASGSTFSVSQMLLGNNVVFNAGDWSGNKFDTTLFIPHTVIPFLSAAGGGSDNARFQDIYISTGALASGTLALRAIGTETTANLKYIFNGNFTIPAGATLNVLAGVKAWVATNSALTVSGSANFGVGSSLTLWQTSSASSQLIVSNLGVVTATGTSFNKSGNWSENTYIRVNDGGRLIASGSTFSVSQMLLGNNIVFNAGDWAGNKFDTTLYIPHTVIPFLSAAGGGSDNARFQDIYINTGTLASGTLDLRAIGTETTVNLKYIFNGNFTVSTTTTLNVLAGVKAWVASNSALTVSGSANFSVGSNLTLWQMNSTFSQLIVSNQGGVTAIDTTFNKSGNWSENTSITVNGRFTATNSSIEPSLLNFNVGSNVTILFNDGTTKIVGGGGIGLVLTNYRSIDVKYGSALTIPQSIRVGETSADSASLNVSYSSTLAVAGSLLGKTRVAANFLPQGRVLLNGSGTSSNPQLVEIMSADRGPSSTGFSSDNFAYGKIELANNTYVRLTNVDVNSVGAPGEALYVNTLVIPTGSKLDLNGQKLFVRAAQIATGALVNGAVVVVPSTGGPLAFIVPDGGPLAFSTPTPGAIDDSQKTSLLPDEWTFTATQNLPVMIQVNPGATGVTAAIAPQLQRVRVELLDSSNTVLKVLENDANGLIVTMQSGNLTTGQPYKIRVRPHSSFTTNTGNYVITLVNSGAAETALSIAAAADSFSKLEGNSGSVTYTYNVTRFGDLSSPGTVQWSVAGVGTNPANAADFTGATFPSGTVTFAALESTKAITVSVRADTDFEQDETFAVTLSSPSNLATISVASATSTILNDDQPQFSDLIVDSISPPLSARSGQTLTLGWTEKNDGPVSIAGNWSTSVKVVNRATNQVIIDTAIPFSGNNIASKASVTRNTTFVLPDGSPGTGNFDITVKVDSANNITEDNIAGTAETNNTTISSFASTVADYPALSVASINVPPSLQLSVPFDVTWSVLNSGNAALTKSIRDRVYLSVDDKIDASDRILATVSADSKLPLAAGATYSQTTSVTLSLDVSIALGVYQILVQTDFANEQFELDETNNVTATPVTVNLPPLPDLIVESITARTLVVAGQSTDVTWVVKNQGTAPAVGSWSDRVYLSDDGVIGGDIALSSFPVSTTILPDGSIQRTQTIQIPAGLAGVYRFVVATDIGNAIQEFNNEGNNSSIDDAVITIDARPSPNLVVDSVTSLTSNLFTGQPATVEWIVRNIGNASTSSSGWVDRLYLSTDGILSNDDLDLGQVQNPSYLNANENYRNSLTITLPQNVIGDRKFIVVTDASNRVEETAGEDDNTRASATTTITLTPPPDLIVTRVTGPSDAFEGEPIIVNWTVRNQGPGPTRVSPWVDQVYLSLNGTDLDNADTLLKTVTHDGVLAAGGAEYAVSNLSALLPSNITSDTAYLIVRTDASKLVYEHDFEGNNDRATEFPMRIVLRPRPDLAVDTITPVPTASAGQPLVVSYRVTNTSVTATRESFWQDSIYLSTDKNLDLQTDLLLGRRNRNGILQGEQSENLSYSFVLDDRLQGDFYVIVSADSANNVLEYDDVNNILAASNSTRIVINPPDLVASSVSSSTAAKAGRQLTINYNVTNRGGNPTPQSSWTDAYYLSADDKIDASDRLLGSRQRNGVLVPNQVENVTTNLQLPTDRFGSNFILVQSDSGDQVYELNNDNNISSLPIFVEDDRPDLVVRSFSPRINNRSIAPGSSVAFDFEVANQGIGPTFGRSWTDRVVLSSDLIVGNGDDVIVGNYTSPTDLAAGRTYFRRSENLTIPSNTPEGLYRLFLVTDAVGGVAELNENNNSLISSDFTVTTTTTDGQLSDLQVTALTVPPTANSGGTFPISWTVKNTGVAPTTSFAWADSVWLSTDGSIDGSDIFVGSFTHYNTLNVNGSYSRTINWPIDIDLTGTFFTIVQTDSSDSVLEGVGEGNNKTVSSTVTNIVLSPTADLRVASITAPAQAFSGRALGLSWTTENAGGGTATASWADSVYLSLDQIFDPGTDISIGYLDHTNNLAGGLNYSANSTLTLPVGLGGTYYVIVATDATNRVYERDLEGNNVGISLQPISIVHTPPADLVVGNITIPANGEIGQSASISYTISNIGQNLARGGWYDAIYISTDATWDIDDGYFGRVFRANDVPANTSYTASLTAPLPGVLPGNYKVIIRSDIRNNLVEDNETNNLKASLDAFATDASALTLGVAKSGTLATNQAVYYRVDVAAGETLVIEFDSANTDGSTELYASFNAVPRRSLAQFSALKPFQTDQRIVISSTQAGTYYILAFGNEVTNGSSNFSILARTVQFTVFDTSYGQGGTAGDRTILIEGAKFDRSVTATLVDSAGRISNTTRYTRVSDTRLYATFDLRALATGMYSVRLTKGSTSATVEVPNSLEVVFATLNLQPISLTRPDTFNRRRGERVPATIPVTVAWRNNTLNDIPVPLIHFSATDPFASTLEDANADKTIFSTEFLGFTESDGPKDILLSGEFTSASFYVRPVKVEATSPLIDINYVAEYFYNDSTANYVWDYDLSQLDLSYLSDAEAIDAIQAFKAARGSTGGALRQSLMEGLQRTGQTSIDIPSASRYLLQEVFDRFVATRQTSIAGAVTANSLATSYKGLVLTLSEVGGTNRYSSAILADGSFVIPKLPAASYAVTISGGSVKAPDGLRVTLVANQHSQLTIPLEPGPATTAITLAPRVPSGIAKVTAPAITKPGKINEVLAGNALESVLPELTGVPYRVEMIGDAPLGFTLGSDGQFRYLSSENTAFVVHYDLVTPDMETRVGRLFNNEIRSRGVIAITLKNNFTRDVRARDPNDIIGPVGYGPEKWVSAAERLPYTIRYENDPKNATTAAQVVRIVQVLDSDLDPNSFQFGDFGFGGHEFKVPTGRQTLNFDLDLRSEIGIIVRVFARIDAATREISWTFSSISPSTGADTTNPDDGFLPLNLLPPQGDGFVSYSIRAKKSAITGAKITASARIIFDGNVPLDTPEIFNTLDATRPTSTIASTESIPTESRLRVKWAGSDGDVGAGLFVYDVYVSENSGRYKPWLQNTKLIDAEYIINATSTYDFVTIAKDNVGNGEEETKLPDIHRPVAFTGGPYSATEGVSLTLNGSGQDPDAGQTLSYEWDFDFDGANFQVDSTSKSPSVLFNDGPSTRTIALRVKDNGTVPLYSSVVTTTVSTANVAPVLTQNASVVSGNVLATLRNSGTWRDVPDDLVSLNASLGSVIKNADGTWSWSYTPTVAVSNQTVTITAEDKDNGKSSISFTLTAIAPTFKPVLSTAEPSITGNRSFVATIDFTKTVTGFGLDDLSLMNATASGLVDLGGGKFSVTLQAQSEGLVKLGVKANSVSDAQGGINVESENLAWTYVDNHQPVAFTGGPYSATEGVALTLVGSGQDSDAGQTLSFEWDLDYDGVAFQVDSTSQSPSVLFNDGPGSRTVGLRVKDNSPLPLTSSVVTTTVPIKNVAPVLTESLTTITGNVSTTFRNNGTWKDVSVDLVTMNASLGEVVQNADGTWTWSYVPTVAVSNQTVTITARDKDNDQSSNSFTITANAPTFKPILSSAEPSITSNRSFVATIDFAKSVSGFAIDDLILLNATASGLVDLGSGKFNVTLQAQSEGLVRLAVKANSATDSQGGLNVESDSIAWTFVDNHQPVAFTGGPYSATEGVVLTLSGSGQDSDVGQTLSYEWDFDFDGVTFQVDSTVQSPSVVFNDGPGSRSIGLRVKDNGSSPLVSAVATTNVSIKNVAPVLTQSLTTVTGNILTTFQNNGTWRDVSVDLVALSASLGGVVKNADGTWSWSYVPTVATVNQSVTITATDKDNGQSTVTFTITAIAPTFKPTLTTAEPAITGNRSFVATIEYTKPVTGFGLDDLVLLNATASELVDLSGGKFNVRLQAQIEGQVRLAVKANSVTDAQGGINVDSDPLVWAYIDVSQSDFGDAPNSAQSGFVSSYPTLLQQDGARHKLTGLKLGGSIDAEPNGLPTLNANGDDTNGVGDEDGIAFGIPIIASRTVSNISSLKATASATGKLDAWIDFNRDGDWNDAGEQILVSSPLNAGANLLSFAIPVGATAGTTYARFRISSAGGLGPNGPALDGEVEDYAVQVLDGDTNRVLTLLAPDVGAHELLVISGKLTVRSESRILFSASADKVDKVTFRGTGNNSIYEVFRPSTNLAGTLGFAGEDKPVRYTIPTSVIDTNLFLGLIAGVGEVDLTGNAGQELRLSLNSVRGLNALKTLKVVADKDDVLMIDRGWKYTQSRLDNGKLVHGYGSSDAKLELQNDSPWQNLINNFDVNGDDSVDPLDVLTIINQINSKAGTSESAKLPDFNPATPSQFSFLDVDGDNSLSPLDVLQVINYINSRAVSGSGEGERVQLAGNQCTDSVFASYSNADFENEWNPQVKQRRFRQK